MLHIITDTPHTRSPEAVREHARAAREEGFVQPRAEVGPRGGVRARGCVGERAPQECLTKLVENNLRVCVDGVLLRQEAVGGRGMRKGGVQLPWAEPRVRNLLEVDEHLQKLVEVHRRPARPLRHLRLCDGEVPKDGEQLFLALLEHACNFVILAKPTRFGVELRMRELVHDLRESLRHRPQRLVANLSQVRCANQPFPEHKHVERAIPNMRRPWIDGAEDATRGAVCAPRRRLKFGRRKPDESCGADRHRGSAHFSARTRLWPRRGARGWLL
mmetsp:Transcript_21499/g.69541  ORF Transcript_21499/g.69541 Transcript_21499/m.69541 type:complete len:273 (-) Transcript_21499:768-1586(-)